MMSYTRSQWQYDNPDEGDNKMVVTRNKSGFLIEVEEEKAVDSYNATFNCTIILSVEKAKELRDYFQQALG